MEMQGMGGVASTDRASMLHTDVKDPGQLPRALDDHQAMLGACLEEMALLRRTLGPLMQESAIPLRGDIDAQPEAPASELTRRMRGLTEDLRLLRDQLVETRVYLDLA